MMRFVLSFGLALLAGACQAGDSANTLTVQRGTKSVAAVTITIAETVEQRQTGLMRVKYMPADQGMLFLFGTERIITMWMRETYIPLDMIFARCGGEIVHIHENAVPHDETIISSQHLASAVLEVNGGYAARHGIQVGDRLVHSKLPREVCAP